MRREHGDEGIGVAAQVAVLARANGK